MTILCSLFQDKVGYGRGIQGITHNEVQFLNGFSFLEECSKREKKTHLPMGESLLSEWIVGAGGQFIGRRELSHDPPANGRTL